MPTNSYKKYHSLKPNTHSELVGVLTDSTEPISSGKGKITVLRTDKDTPQELFCHNTFDILYALDCDAEVEVCGKTMVMKKYNVMFIAPGVPYRVAAGGMGIMPVITVDKRALYTHFHRISVFDGVIAGFFGDAMWGEAAADHLLFTSVSTNSIDSLVNMIIEEQCSEGSGTDFIKVQLLMCILGYLCAQPASAYEISANRISRSEQISKILTFIQDNYRTVTLEKLAEYFHYTVPYVSKLVRSATGLTFTEILREIKFDVCRSLLLNSDLKINKIAEVAGFQNTDHFNRVFKKHMGITPTEFRKERY